MENLELVSETVSKDWAIGSIVRIRQVQSGAVNLVYQLDTHDNIYFLCQYKTQNIEIIRREHDLIQRVQMIGLPAVAPLKFCTGGTILDMNEDVWALFPKAEGKQTTSNKLTLSHVAGAGEMLGRLHKK